MRVASSRRAVEDGVPGRGTHAAPLLNPGVVLDAHPREQAQLLPPQAWDTSAPKVRQANILGLEPSAARAQKLVKFGSGIDISSVAHH